LGCYRNLVSLDRFLFDCHKRFCLNHLEAAWFFQHSQRNGLCSRAWKQAATAGTSPFFTGEQLCWASDRPDGSVKKVKAAKDFVNNVRPCNDLLEVNSESITVREKRYCALTEPNYTFVPCFCPQNSAITYT